VLDVAAEVIRAVARGGPDVDARHLILADHANDDVVDEA